MLDMRYRKNKKQEPTDTSGTYYKSQASKNNEKTYIQIMCIKN